MKKVSIIMPVYNGEEYLKESIQSIINQSYTNWELIIVNEYGSNDKSSNIIKDFAKKDKRIILIQNKKREGISESLNIALRKCTGEYIARMDSDDISGTNRLSTQVEFLDANKEIGLCGIQPEYFGTEKIYWDLETDPVQIRNNIFFYTPCVHPTIMFRREIIDKYKIFYNKEYKSTEDYDFFSRVVSVTNIANIRNKSLFKYRMYADNATSRNKDRGIKIYSEVMKNCFKNYLSLEFTDDEINLLNSHISTGEKTGKELYDAVVELDILLKKILLKTKDNKKFATEIMFKTLKKRWQELRWSIKEKNRTSAVDFIIDKSIFNRETFSVNNKFDIKQADITILLPAYNSEKYILDSVLSLLDQTYKDFIVYVMIEYGNTDKTEDYLSLLNDNRIKIIKNKEKLGLAKTLNEGIKLAKTKFIARMDSDDISLSERLEKERNYLVDNFQTALVCSYQRHFGDFGTYIHSVEGNSDDLAASLLFRCDICHSTVMFRRDVMINNNYYYDSNMAMEDFDLWNRMLINGEKLYCIPEVLGEYRIHGENITQSKHQKVIDSEIKIISRSLERLNIDKSSYDERLLIGWDYLYDNNPNLIKKAKKLFKRILENNKTLNIYNQSSLERVIMRRINWIKGTEDYIEKEKYISPYKQSKIKLVLKKILKPIIMPVYSRLMYRIEYMIDEKNNNTKNDYNVKTNDLKKNFELKINDINNNIDKISKTNNMNYNEINNKINDITNLITNIQKYFEDQKGINYISYSDGKIRIAIIFQVASFWPSIESVYEKLLHDDRFELKFYLLNQPHMEPSQMAGAKDFLIKNSIEYEELTIQRLKTFNPYVAIIQTPYDEWHRSEEFSSKNLRKMGIRLVYIPYGIELGGSQESIKYQYSSDFFNNLWRIYTLSEVTQKYFCIYSKQTINEVKAFGHPKFDGLVNQKFTTNYDFKKLANGKKIILVKIHFPIVFNGYIVTPNLKVYIDLLDRINNYNDFYFIFMLHPLLFDDNKNTLGKELVEKINSTKNIFVFKDEDYREPLIAADAFVCDRSSLAVEIGVFNKPILFIENTDNKEIFIEEFDKLFSSYEKGTTYQDIEQFLRNVRDNNDMQKDQRKSQFQKCVHLYDGKASERIVNDIYDSLLEEKNDKDKL